MTAHSKPINLLPASEFEASFWGRFLKWSITAGRKVIILTELIVILAFLSRFKLDEDIRRTNNEITFKKSQLESEIGFEKKFLETKAQVSAAKLMENKKTDLGKNLKQLAVNIPLEVRLENVLVEKNSIKLAGLAVDEKSLGEMLTRLDNSTDWKSIELVNITAQAGKGVRFQLNLTK